MDSEHAVVAKSCRGTVKELSLYGEKAVVVR